MTEKPWGRECTGGGSRVVGLEDEGGQKRKGIGRWRRCASGNCWCVVAIYRSVVGIHWRGGGGTTGSRTGAMKGVLCLETMPILGYILISILRLDAAPATTAMPRQ